MSGGDFKRISGDNMTQEFLGELPADWAVAKMMLDSSKLKMEGYDAEKLAKYDLCQETARRWTMKPTGVKEETDPQKRPKINANEAPRCLSSAPSASLKSSLGFSLRFPALPVI